VDRFLECPRCGFRRRIDVHVLTSGLASCPRCEASHGAPVAMTIAPQVENQASLRSKPSH
jgi:hypothetical protein